ncbi:unnamed protein product [Pieris macdunnoughi]|uniref:Uncharacterized protein n=1 Tax=Pieris macdunnoughi TaxID=345717 RepID=A0A821QS64_9NEOP|nr:unnamed protein product [Pieris macdunnoughi]
MICEIIPKNMWRYINSSENPADCASRGSTALHLTSLSLWWHGPEWLSQCNLKEHSEKPTYTTDIDLKKKNLEISELSVAKVLNKKSQILNLNPVLDSTGLLRVGGRLKNSNIDPEMKYPIIIPSQSKLAELIIDEAHELVFHGGAKLTAVRDDWRLIVYYDTYPYQEGTAALMKDIQYLKTICSMIKEQLTHCDGITLQLEHEFDEMKHYNDIVIMSNSFDTGAKRQRRGLIDGVGYVANSLFGLLDHRFAEKYEKDIDLLRENENHLFKLWKNQTSVVEAELNLMKRMESTMTKQHKIVNQKLNNLENSNLILKQKIQNASFISDFITSAFITNNLLYNLRRIQDFILDTVTNIYSGKLDFHLISPKQLRSELNLISAQLPSDLALPVDNFHFQDIYSLLKVKTKNTKKYLIIEIRIPLVERNIYEIFNLISIPRISNGSMETVIPTSNLVGINIQKDSYITISESDFQSCLNQNPTTMFCHIRNPIRHLKDDHDLCKTIPNTRICQTTFSPCRNHWRELSSPNKYYSFCCKECNIKLLCERQIKSTKVSNAGLLSVMEGCIIKTKDFQVYSHKRLSSNISISSEFEALEMSPINNIINISISKLQTHDLDSNSSEDIRQFEEIKRNIEILKQSETLSTKISYHDVHHYFIIYVLIAILVVLAIIAYWRRLRRRASAEPAVEAVTRSIEATSLPSPQPVKSDSVVSIPPKGFELILHIESSITTCGLVQDRNPSLEPPITYFRVVDRLGIGRGPKIEIIRGGLRHKYLVLRLQSIYGYPISVNVYVGCENKMQLKTIKKTSVVATTIKAITTDATTDLVEKLGPGSDASDTNSTAVPTTIE